MLSLQGGKTDQAGAVKPILTLKITAYKWIVTALRHSMQQNKYLDVIVNGFDTK